MARFEFKLPDVGEGVAEAEIVAWHVKAGDLIEADQPFLDVMTDKATVEITSPVSGKVILLEGEPGLAAAVGSVVAVLETDQSAGDIAGAAPVEAASQSPTNDAPLVPLAVTAASAETSEPRPSPSQTDPRPPSRPLASPAVRRRALELGVDLRLVRGSGPAGRISQEDLDAYHSGARSVAPGRTRRTARDEVTEIKVIGLRRRIAERMAEAKRRIPHFSYIEELDVTELELLRNALNAETADRPRLTFLPFLALALAKVLPRFPQINATYDDDANVLTQHSALHLGVATQTEAGLVVPVVRHVEARDLWDIAAEVRRLADAARSGRALREELTGSTLTVTSLGALGGVATTPVINRPEVAIVGPNRIIERPVIVSGAIVPRKMMNLSSSFDHRVVDGWHAAQFVQAVKTLIERPALLFVDGTDG